MEETVQRNSALNQTKAPTVVKKKKNTIPDDILLNEELNRAIRQLPSNYNFEIHKTIYRIKSENIKNVALQFPEGLLMYACLLSDIFSTYANAEILILSDVTYGACCIDDYTASILGAELLVHYGHSCLVPINVTKIKVMYVFVEIYFDHSHLSELLRQHFKPESKLCIMGTIQFNTTIANIHNDIKEHFAQVYIPQTKPLSAAETLGCTSPILPESDALIFVADGRFHLEAAMIRNPNIPAFRYDPYCKILSSESYDIEKMKEVRFQAIEQAKSASIFGVILGTLGHQGNPSIFNRINKLLLSKGKQVIPFLMAEIMPAKLSKLEHIEVFVQVACPRLSIDWSNGFNKPLLTPYELEVALNKTSWKEVYPMDYYSSDGGSWSNYYKDP